MKWLGILGHRTPANHGQTEELDPALRSLAESLTADVVATLGWAEAQARSFVESSLSSRYIDASDPGLWTLMMADNVQQDVHDSFTDTTWPRCPRHRNHPLWLRQEFKEIWWTCTHDAERVARLGALET